jgi:hypothetical protein
MLYRIAVPDHKMDFRGAYQFVHAHMEPTDNLWSITTVVHQTYYGKSAPLLLDSEFDEAVQRAGSQRIWVVIGERHYFLRERFETNARVAFRHHVGGLDVLLFVPRNDATARVSPGNSSP